MFKMPPPEMDSLLEKMGGWITDLQLLIRDMEPNLSFLERCDLVRIVAEMGDEKQDLRVELMAQFPQYDSDHEDSEAGEDDQIEVLGSDDSEDWPNGPDGSGQPIPQKAFPKKKG